MNFFDKQEYTIQDIQALIDNSIEESINLDFKAADSLQNSDPKKKEIAKDVSAFANSDGGIIVYGLKEQDHRASAFSFINGDTFTKEWLEQVINTNINQRIQDLKIFPVRRNGVDETIYIVKIPRSRNAPHMTKEKRYYKRFNFESVYMEEYEVRWTYNQKDKTELEILTPIIGGGGMQGGIGNLRYCDFSITFQVKNVSNSIEDRYKLELKVHINIVNSADNSRTMSRYPNRREGDYMFYSIPNESSLFQEEQITGCVLHLRAAGHNKVYLCNNPITLKLYYSNGTKVNEYNLGDILTLSGHQIRNLDFL